MHSPNHIVYQIRQYGRRAMDILSNEGGTVLLDRLWMKVKRLVGIDYLGNFDLGYDRWYRKYNPSISQDRANRLIEEMEYKPIFSIIVPVYNVEAQWLLAAIHSVKSQLYPHWQLCLVDDASDGSHVGQILSNCAGSDPRIRIQCNKNNQGISETSNIALTAADGEFVALLDHDDVLTDDALLQNALLINAEPEVDLIYSDEDKISVRGKLSSPYFKPNFSKELLHGQNYIGHFVIIRKSLVDEIGGFRNNFDGAQDYDLVLRIVEKTTRIKHISKVLYHWREIPGSTAASFGSKSYAWEAGKNALQDHLQRQNEKATADKGPQPGTYQIRREISTTPLVSIIIPFKDQGELLDKCLASLFEKSSWTNLEILAIDNNSELDKTKQLVEAWQVRDQRIRVLSYSQPFNFSGICNYGVDQAQGEFVVLLNSDIEFLSPKWTEELLQYAQQSEIGAVGGKLIYPDRTIQHNGIVVGIDGGAGHPFKRFPENHRGYFTRLELAHNVSAVTAALLMVHRKKYLDVGGLNDSEFAVAYNDVDFCLKLITTGFRNVVTPYCKAIHHESRTRGYETSQRKRNRHDKEKQHLREMWPDYFETGDPLYNSNLTLVREDYSLNFR